MVSGLIPLARETYETTRKGILAGGHEENGASATKGCNDQRGLSTDGPGEGRIHSSETYEMLTVGAKFCQLRPIQIYDWPLEVPNLLESTRRNEFKK